MIHAIELENFKGVGARTRIELAPVTLLFGANNAGKSTILQALLFVHEVLRTGSPEVDRTYLGDAVVELGGFSRIVHRHDKTRTVRVRVEFDTPGTLNRLGRDLTDSPFADLDDDVDRAWLEFTAAYRPEIRAAVVEAVGVGVGNIPLAGIVLGTSLRDGEPMTALVNTEHPLIAGRGGDVFAAAANMGDVRWRGPVNGGGVNERGEPLHWADWAAGWTQFDNGQTYRVFVMSRTRASALPALNEPLRLLDLGASTSSPSIRALAAVRTFFEMAILGIAGQLADTLARTLYIGPLRAVPPRGSLFERSGASTRWADGLAAWESLLSDRGTLVATTNTWLAKLGTGCKVVVQQLLDPTASAEDVAAEHADISVRRLLLDSGAGLVLPSELGAGISQVVPVVVAALVPIRGGIVMIEQPEIHVHPALQVELGDLVITSATDRQLLIETHSEHLILRLLRRIRETHEGELPESAPAFEPDKLSVLYVERSAEGATTVRRLHVDLSGEFTDRWPKGFFAERMGELL